MPCTPCAQRCKKGCDLLQCDVEAVILKVFGHFSVSAKHAEALNDIFQFMEMEGDTLLRVSTHIIVRHFPERHFPKTKKP